MTTTSGIAVPSNDTSLTAGSHGPLLIQDWPLFEKHAHFNRERIPERVVNTKGAGAYGTFTVTDDLTKFSSAKLFAEIGKTTNVFVRFSSVCGERGTPDTVRDIRGFAVKFYTEQGNWDLVAQNTPVFFIRDPYKFPDFVRSQRRDPRTNLRNPTHMWDFWSLSPESVHQLTIFFADRGVPKNFRHMHGYGNHSFSFINCIGHRFWVKFHLRSMQGIQNCSAVKHDRDEIDNDIYQRDLYGSLEDANYPRWKLCVQIMPEQEADSLAYGAFDATRTWSQKDYPLRQIGVIELNRNPDNYFAEVEQAAFSPASVVPGIGFSPDKLLQLRLWSYADAQRYRLGVNHMLLPINRPQCPTHTYARDGAMRGDGNGGGFVNYAPNSFSGPAALNLEEDPGVVVGPVIRLHPKDQIGDFAQARVLFEKFDSDQRGRLFQSIAESMRSVAAPIVERQLALFSDVHPDYSDGIRAAL